MTRLPHRSRILSAGLCAVAVASLLPATETDAAEEAEVYFMLPNSTTIRFERRDAPLFEQAMAERMPTASVTVQNGQGDPTRQQRLVEDAIAQGADLIVYTSSDANLAAGALNAAEQAGVPVILYEHDAIGGKAEAHVLFDALAVGQAQGARAAEHINAMDKDVVKVARVKGNQGEYGTMMYEQGQNEHLQPLIDSGKVEVVCEDFTPNWDPVQAQAFAEDCLTRTGGDVDLFLGMNDGTTGGSVAALISQGYAPGEVIVTGGQDATIEALQFIVQGWQDNTVFKDLRTMASAAADLSVVVLEEEGMRQHINGAVHNQYMNMPAAFLPVENVTADNVEMVVDAGIYTWEEICQGSEDSEVCQENL